MVKVTGRAHGRGRTVSLAGRLRGRAVLLALMGLLVAACASRIPVYTPSHPAATSSTIKRCSPNDPDRDVWFCGIGQFLYYFVGDNFAHR